ncbi:hypothetical protein V6N13_088527 [Hibiscus sabdariffa]|uniref:Uncharacterized protein n=1 Tax=Hibiscus sabdariffa TaxID=183260 RepID=A0ABR2G099_9ROSI
MGPQGFGSMDLEAELEEQKKVTRRMEDSARAIFVAYVDKTLQRFDEKDMMITISKMRNNDAGDMGGLECFYGDVVSKIGLSLEEKAAMDAILATVKAGGSSGGRNGGFSGEYGDDFLKTKLGFDMVKNSGSRGDNKSELADGYEREGGMVVDDIEEKPNSKGNGLEVELRRGGEYGGTGSC